MDQEKFINTYIEKLNNTIFQQIKNILLLETRIELAEKANEEIIKNSVSHETLSEKDNKILELQHIISSLHQNLNSSNQDRQNLEVFKNELLGARSEINRLNSLINQLNIDHENEIKKMQQNLNSTKEEPKVVASKPKSKTISKTSDDF